MAVKVYSENEQELSLRTKIIKTILRKKYITLLFDPLNQGEEISAISIQNLLREYVNFPFQIKPVNNFKNHFDIITSYKDCQILLSVGIQSNAIEF